MHTPCLTFRLPLSVPAKKKTALCTRQERALPIAAQEKNSFRFSEGRRITTRFLRPFLSSPQQEKSSNLPLQNNAFVARETTILELRRTRGKPSSSSPQSTSMGLCRTTAISEQYPVLARSTN